QTTRWVLTPAAKDPHPHGDEAGSCQGTLVFGLLHGPVLRSALGAHRYSPQKLLRIRAAAEADRRRHVVDSASLAVLVAAKRSAAGTSNGHAAVRLVATAPLGDVAQDVKHLVVGRCSRAQRKPSNRMDEALTLVVGRGAEQREAHLTQLVGRGGGLDPGAADGLAHALARPLAEPARVTPVHSATRLVHRPKLH